MSNPLTRKHAEGYKSRGYYAVVRLDWSKIMAEVEGRSAVRLKPLGFQERSLMKVPEIPFVVVEEGEVSGNISVQSPEQVFVPTGEILKDKVAQKNC